MLPTSDVMTVIIYAAQMGCHVISLKVNHRHHASMESVVFCCNLINNHQLHVVFVLSCWITRYMTVNELFQIKRQIFYRLYITDRAIGMIPKRQLIV